MKGLALRSALAGALAVIVGIGLFLARSRPAPPRNTAVLPAYVETAADDVHTAPVQRAEAKSEKIRRVRLRIEVKASTALNARAAPFVGLEVGIGENPGGQWGNPYVGAEHLRAPRTLERIASNSNGQAEFDAYLQADDPAELVFIRVASPGFLPSVTAARLRTDDNTLHLIVVAKRGALLHGLVQDEAEQPVAGAAVVVRRQVGSVWETIVDDIRTDDDGRFSLEILRHRSARQVSFFAIKESSGVGTTVLSNLHVSKPPEEVVIRLHTTTSLSGQVVDSTGAAVSGLVVRALATDPPLKSLVPGQPWSERGLFRAVTTTDESGAFRLANLETGMFRLHGSLTEGLWLRSLYPEPVEAGRSGLRLVLRYPRMEVFVFDSFGAPLALDKHPLFCADREAGPPRISVRHLTSPTVLGPGVAVVPARHGRGPFPLLESKSHIEDVGFRHASNHVGFPVTPGERYVVTFFSHNHRYVSREVEASRNGGSTIVEITAYPRTEPAELSVTLTLDGEPFDGGYAIRASADAVGRAVWDRHEERHAGSVSQGAHRVIALPPGKYTITAVAPVDFGRSDSARPQHGPVEQKVELFAGLRTDLLLSLPPTGTLVLKGDGRSGILRWVEAVAVHENGLTVPLKSVLSVRLAGLGETDVRFAAPSKPNSLLKPSYRRFTVSPDREMRLPVGNYAITIRFRAGKHQDASITIRAGETTTLSVRPGSPDPLR